MATLNSEEFKAVELEMKDEGIVLIESRISGCKCWALHDDIIFDFVSADSSKKISYRCTYAEKIVIQTPEKSEVEIQCKKLIPYVMPEKD